MSRYCGGKSNLKEQLTAVLFKLFKNIKNLE